MPQAENPWDGPKRDRQEMHRIPRTPFPGELAVPSNPAPLFILTQLPVRSFFQPKHPSQGLPAQLSSVQAAGSGWARSTFTLIWEVIISAFTRDDGPIMERKLIMRGEEKLMSCSGPTLVIPNPLGSSRPGEKLFQHQHKNLDCAAPVLQHSQGTGGSHQRKLHLDGNKC